MMKRLNVAGHSTHDYENFKSLIMQMLEYDAKDRVRPLDALQHPFFKMNDLVDSKNSTSNSSSVPRTPTAPAAAVNQNNREFQTIQLAAMLNERSQLERSTLERSQLQRIQSDEKADAFQFDLLQKYQKLYKSPGKQALSTNDLDRGFRGATATQLRSGATADDLHTAGQPQPAISFPYFLYQDDHTPDHNQFVNALAQQRTNNGERLAFDLAGQHAGQHTGQPVGQHANQRIGQHAGQMASIPANVHLVDKTPVQSGLSSDLVGGEADGKRSRFRKQNSGSSSLINFSSANSIGSNLNLADHCDLNSFAFVDAFSPSNGHNGYANKLNLLDRNQFNSNQFDASRFDSNPLDDRLEGKYSASQFDRQSNGRYAKQPHYDFRQFNEHYPSFKQSRRDQPCQAISSTISSLNLLDRNEYSHFPNGVRPAHRNRALSSSIGNLNLLNGHPATNNANHSSSFLNGMGQFYENKNSKRKSYANEFYFK